MPLWHICCSFRCIPLQNPFCLSVLFATFLFAQASYAGKKQTFTKSGNKVVVEAVVNEGKVYEEAGKLYLVPGQSYKFKLTGTAAKNWKLIGDTPLTTGVIQVPASNPPDSMDLTGMTFDDGENKVAVVPVIKVVRPVLDTLSVETEIDAGISHDPNDKSNEDLYTSIWILGGGSKPHTGRVTIKPAAARKEFQLRLYQMVNATGSSNDAVIQKEVDKKMGGKANIKGEDKSYTAYNHGEHTEIGEDKLETKSSDYPGLQDNRRFWEETVFYTKKATVNYSINANLYLQYSLVENNSWNTVGKVEWGVKVEFNPVGKSKFTESAMGGKIAPEKGDVKKGIKWSETPVAPESSEATFTP